MLADGFDGLGASPDSYCSARVRLPWSCATCCAWCTWTAVAAQQSVHVLRLTSPAMLAQGFAARLSAVPLISTVPAHLSCSVCS